MMRIYTRWPPQGTASPKHPNYSHVWSDSWVLWHWNGFDILIENPCNGLFGYFQFVAREFLILILFDTSV